MKHKRILALLMAAVLIMTLLPTPVFSAASDAEEDAAQTSQTEAFLQDLPEIIDTQAAREKGHTQRLRDEEGEHLNKLVFGNADGTKTMYLYDHPVKYRDKQGQIHDISLEIADTNDSAYPFRTRANSAVTEFPASLPDGITLSGNGVDLRISTQLPVGNTALNHFARRVDNNTIAYTYDANTTIEYALTYTGFKEEIVVSAYTGQTEYPFLLYTNGLNLQSIDDGYYLTDESGTIQAAIGDIIVFTADERNNTMGTLQVTCLKPGQIYGLTIVLDADYLADPATVYPIRIDPTVQLVYTDENPNAIEEKTIQSNNTTSGTNTATVIGKNSKGISRSLMKFPGMDFTSLEGSVVTSAVVTIRDLMCQEEAMTVTCYPFTGDVWTESSTQWANLTQSWGAALSSNVVSYSSGTQQTTAHRYCFNITSLAQQWVNGTADPAKGIIFRADAAVENASTTLTKTFGTSERASYRPTFEITYKDKISIEQDGVHVDEGSTITLTATSVLGTDAALTWSAEPSAVATVDANGVVTGHQAGKATITVFYVDEDGNRISASCIVYVTVPDGLYYIKNAASGFCLQTTEDNAYMYAQNTNHPARINQLWKITYIANGRYVIRPLRDYSVALTVNNSYIAVDEAATDDEEVTALWAIQHEDSGYSFKYGGSDAKTMMPVVSGMSGSQVYSGNSDSSTSSQWTLEEAYGVFLRDTNTLRTITATTTRYIELSRVYSLTNLDISYECYGSTEAVLTSSNNSVASFFTPGALTAVDRGEAMIVISMTHNENTYQQSFVVNCVVTVNLEVQYDQGYLSRYPDAFTRLSDQLNALKEFYLSEFYIAINYTSPLQITSYADECSFAYNEPCLHGISAGVILTESYDCNDSHINSDDSVNLENYHHKNIFNIMYRIAFPDIDETYKMVFTGHETCMSIYGECSRQQYNGNPANGVTIEEIGLILICDFVSADNEVKTIIHEFGHLFHAPDHYDNNCLSTDDINTLLGVNTFSPNCIYGENKGNPDIVANKTICAGCRDLIESYINADIEN